MRVGIGGLPVVIRSRELAFLQIIAEKYGDFAVPARYLVLNGEDGDVDGDIGLENQSGSPMQVEMNIRKLEEETKSEFLDEELWVEVSYRNNCFFIQRPDLEAEVDLSSRVSRVVNRAAIYSFDSFLRILYSLLLVQEGGFLLHAASIIKDNKGYIFMGRSGAGKSTVAYYSSDYTVLSDEISLIRQVGQDYFLYSTPFWGEQEIKGVNLYSPIQGIYQLRQSLQSGCKRLLLRESLGGLMENILYFATEPFLTAKMFQNCTNFIDHIAFYELKFQKNNSNNLKDGQYA